MSRAQHAIIIILVSWIPSIGAIILAQWQSTLDQATWPPTASIRRWVVEPISIVLIVLCTAYVFAPNRMRDKHWRAVVYSLAGGACAMVGTSIWLLNASGNERHSRIMCYENLNGRVRGAYGPIREFAKAHLGAFPDDLAYLGSLSDPSAFSLHCPSVPRSNASASDYSYVKGLHVTDPMHWIILFEDDIHHGGEEANVLRIDSHVYSLSNAEIVTQLALQQQEFERMYRRPMVIEYAADCSFAGKLPK